MEDNIENEKPPVFQSWKGWYMLLLIVLVGLIGLFYWFKISFS